VAADAAKLVIVSLLRHGADAEALPAGPAAAAIAIDPGEEDGEASGSDPAVAAFFDVDNTIMRGASMYHFARGLASRRFLTPRDLARFAWHQVLFRVWGAEIRSHIHAAREAALAFVAGHRVDELRLLGEEIYDELVAERIWAGTRALAQHHLECGQPVWLVTATPVELASILTERLGLTGALGTVSETRDGVYTGRLVGEILHGPAKAEAVRSLAEQEGIDLSRCYAYSDSINDLPMLSLVGHPCAVNPDSALRDHAEERGWPVYDFRSGRKATITALGWIAAVVAATGSAAAVKKVRRSRRYPALLP
jgi:HAD superfamily hydrolase (TIGR01490 family)